MLKSILLVFLFVAVFSQYQKGIISDTKEYAAYLTFRITQKIVCKPILKELSAKTLQYGDNVVMGLGQTIRSMCEDSSQINIPRFNVYPNIKEFPHTGIFFILPYQEEIFTL
jgi:hypothetical protein